MTKFNTVKFGLLPHLNQTSNLPKVFQDIVNDETLGKDKYAALVCHYRKDFNELSVKLTINSQHFDWTQLCRNLTTYFDVSSKKNILKIKDKEITDLEDKHILANNIQKGKRKSNGIFHRADESGDSSDQQSGNSKRKCYNNLTH